MLDRRQSARDKVIYGGVAEIDEHGTTRECIVRNISDKGASVEFSNVVRLPREQMSLRIARKGRSFLARVMWWRDNFVGLAFSADSPVGAGVRSGRTAAQKRNQEAPASAPDQGTARRRLTDPPSALTSSAAVAPHPRISPGKKPAVSRHAGFFNALTSGPFRP